MYQQENENVLWKEIEKVYLKIISVKSRFGHNVYQANEFKNIQKKTVVDTCTRNSHTQKRFTGL